MREAFVAWLEHRDFRDAVSGHLPGDADSQDRAEIIIERIEAIVDGAQHGDAR